MVTRSADIATRPQPLRRHWATIGPWLAIAALLAIQQVLLRLYALREVTWAYPTNFDQVQYLSQSYDTYAHIQADGLLPGLGYGLQLWAPQGMLIHLQASLLFTVLGPTRLSALTLNFMYFALFQITLVATLRWLTRRWDMTLIGLGLLLTFRSPFFTFGGIMDFRIDFVAFCLFGMLLCLVIRSELFSSWRWSLAVGALAIMLVLFRFITATYLAGIFGAFGLFLLIRLWSMRNKPEARAQTIKQLRGLVLAGVLFSIVVLPALWNHREQLWSYYGIGHFAGEEKEIRAREANISNIVVALLFYPRSVVAQHAGIVFSLAGAIMLAALAWVCRDRSAPSSWHLRPALDLRMVYLFLIICLVVPYTILTLDVSKSPAVGNIFAPVVLWLIMISAMALLRYQSSAAGTLAAPGSLRPPLAALNTSTMLSALLMLSMGTGIIYQLVQFSRPSLVTQRRSDTEQALRLNDLIFQYSQAHGLVEPRVSTDHIVDYMNANLLNVVIYERYGVFLRSQAGLGTSIFAIEPANAIDQIRRSDFVVLSTPRSEEQLVFPFDMLMQTLHPQLVTICEEHFVQLDRFQIANRDLVLYARRD